MRKIAFAAVGTALALSLAACGGTSNNGQGGGSGGGGLSIMANVTELANQVNQGAEKGSSAKVSFDASMMGQSIKGTGSYRLKPDAAMDLTLDSPQGSIRVVLVDEALYLQLPEAERSALGGKPWVKISADGDDPVSKALGPALKQMADSADVVKQVQQIKDAGTITKSQSEQLNGQQVVHYWIDVDVAKLAAVQKEELAKAGLEQLQKKGITKIAEELWVQADGLPAQVSTEVPTGQGQPGKVTLGFTDWGKPVTVTAPPADQIGELPKMGG